MIINDLIDQYKVLEKLDKVPYFGWSRENVPYALEIDGNGELQQVMALGDTSAKKPRNMVFVPTVGMRTSGTNPLFIWDNAEYLLGSPTGGDEERAEKRFTASAELHERLLENVHDETGEAVKAFFKRPPQWEKAAQQFGADWEKISRSYFTFMVDGRLAKDDPEIRSAWDNRQGNHPIDESVMRESLASGKMVVPAATHPAIKGVRGAQSSGALLVSFNAHAFESFGQEQGSNAPLSRREAFEYTTALNTLLSDRDRVNHLDNVTVVTWSETGETTYSDVMDVAGFGNNLFAAPEATKGNKSEPDGRGQMLLEQIESAVKALAQGKTFDVDRVTLSPDEHFSVLGLAPNAARLSVVFYLRDNFGSFMKNIEQHYSDTEIMRPKYDTTKHMSMYRILRQTVNPNSKNAASSPGLSSALIKSVLRGSPYPATLLDNVEMRIRAERDVPPDKAAIIKAYYLRLSRLRPIIANDEVANQKFKEVLQVDINEDSDYVPYVLGRMFSVYEQIQKAANPNINTTIKDKYFNSAAATPSRIFGILGELSAKHLKKSSMNPGARVNLTKELERLSIRIGDRYPNRLSLPEQGAFQLGYYFEDQAQYRPKKNND